MKSAYFLSRVSFALFLLLIGCQTHPRKGFDQIKNGMGKDEVLLIAGPPKTSNRFRGHDRWIYVFQNDNQPPTVKEIHFDAGHVIFVGDKIIPNISAEEQDRRNEESNAAEYQRVKEEERRHREEIDLLVHPPIDKEKEASKRAPVYEPL